MPRSTCRPRKNARPTTGPSHALLPLRPGRIARRCPPSASGPDSCCIPSRPTLRRPYSVPQTIGTAGYSPVAPSTSARFGSYRESAVAMPEAVSLAQSMADQCRNTSDQTLAIAPSARCRTTRGPVLTDDSLVHVARAIHS